MCLGIWYSIFFRSQVVLPRRGKSFLFFTIIFFLGVRSLPLWAVGCGLSLTSSLLCPPIYLVLWALLCVICESLNPSRQQPNTWKREPQKQTPNCLKHGRSMLLIHLPRLVFRKYFVFIKAVEGGKQQPRPSYLSISPSPSSDPKPEGNRANRP